MLGPMNDSPYGGPNNYPSIFGYGTSADTLDNFGVPFNPFAHELFNAAYPQVAQAGLSPSLAPPQTNGAGIASPPAPPATNTGFRQRFVGGLESGARRFASSFGRRFGNQPLGMDSSGVYHQPPTAGQELLRGAIGGLQRGGPAGAMFGLGAAGLGRLFRRPAPPIAG